MLLSVVWRSRWARLDGGGKDRKEGRTRKEVAQDEPIAEKSLGNPGLELQEI